MARRTRSGQQNLVDHVDHAVVCFDVCDDDVGHFTGAIGDGHACLGCGDAQTLGFVDRLEVVGPRREIARHQHAVIDVVKQHVGQLADVLFHQQCLNGAFGQGGKGIVHGCIDREFTRTCQRVGKASCGDSGHEGGKPLIACCDFGDGRRRCGRACDGQCGGGGKFGERVHGQYPYLCLCCDGGYGAIMPLGH